MSHLKDFVVLTGVIVDVLKFFGIGRSLARNRSGVGVYKM